MSSPSDAPTSPSFSDKSFVALQKLLPTLALTGLANRIACSKNRMLSQFLIRQAISAFDINMADAAETDPKKYASFNAFFTRALRKGARPLADTPALASPVDGCISQLGDIQDGRIIQAKGLSYTVEELLGDPAAAEPYRHGRFATIYLAPSDYHRIHMPLDGTALSSTYLPGRLLSVNPATVRTAQRVFSENERMACHFQSFDSDQNFAVVLVGALFVSGLETVLTGSVTPPHGGRQKHWRHHGEPTLARGAELGRFNYGSTVILLLPSSWNWEPELKPSHCVRMGQALAYPNEKNNTLDT